MRIQNDPFKKVIQIVRRRYPKAKAEIWFVNGGLRGAKGYTFFPNDGSTPRICISAELPVWGATDVLAHELAHLVLGPGPKNGKHSPKWKKTFDWIFKEFCKQSSGDGRKDG